MSIFNHKVSLYSVQTSGTVEGTPQMGDVLVYKDIPCREIVEPRSSLGTFAEFRSMMSVQTRVYRELLLKAKFKGQPLSLNVEMKASIDSGPRWNVLTVTPIENASKTIFYLLSIEEQDDY